MGEIMRPISFDHLLSWALKEHERCGSVFGLRKEKFYRQKSGKFIEIFNNRISSAIGPAAGPHSQMAQNILVSYLAGARFIELKTVQKMDGEELRKCVPRPCIHAEDEGYNVEWSTEFTVEEAYNEYVKAWFLIHVLMKEFQISNKKDFIFNMSVGYDLQGIQSEKIDRFIEGMKDATDTDIWRSCKEILAENLHRFQYFNQEDLEKIEPVIANSITLSTLHGCPAQEIEQIAQYLLENKKVHTYIKCNPTLLGFETARTIVDQMGYDYLTFDDHHFKEDLQLSEAKLMLRRLQDLARKLQLEFGVKITNTFPVKIMRNELPGEEMYMSGRALYPLSIHVAALIATEFDGTLPISYSGGADHFNLKDILACNIQPVTVATTLLKPGGYARLTQLAAANEDSLNGPFKKIDVDALNLLAKQSLRSERHQKNARKTSSTKTAQSLPLFDCYKAPCQKGGCPIEQQIPEYVRLAGEKKYEEAFQVIAIDNPLPSITGQICDHRCQQKCVRNNYEDPVEIRSTKYLSSYFAQDKFIQTIKPAEIKSKHKVLIIGAGPAGVSLSVFLRRNGMDVTVHEKTEKPMGIVQHVIPSFRVSDQDIHRDYRMALAMGVKFVFGVNEDYNIEELKKEFYYVVLATGAWKEGRNPLQEGSDEIWDALDFLTNYKNDSMKIELGKKVAVLGGGDVAMDCARAAKRCLGVEEVTIVYRRTKEWMPASLEEYELAVYDHIQFLELKAPLSFHNRMLSVEKQVMVDEYDQSGRKKMQGTGQVEELVFDSVIGAVGARVDTGLFQKNGLQFKGAYPYLNHSLESSIPNVYVAGDCKSGASTVVKAIADAKSIASDILSKEGLTTDFYRIRQLESDVSIYKNKGNLKPIEESNRCLACDFICEMCNEVCPNRANVFITVRNFAFETKHQIVHLDGMCNECGNCAHFCPYNGKPYKDKFTLFWTLEDFEDSENVGFLQVNENDFMIRNEKGVVSSYQLGEENISVEMKLCLETLVNDYPYYFQNQKIKASMHLVK